jgi:pSer/pThr/pTyr-binding forkhead associated (FHA) protein
MLSDQYSRVPAAQITLDPAGNSAATRSAEVAAIARTVEFTLVVTEGEAVGRRLPVGHAPVVIGRGVGVDLQIPDPTVSRHHCVIWRASGRCWVRDLGSTNQTRVNKRSALITELFDGDILVIGQTSLTLGSSRRHDDSARAIGGANRDG